MASPNGDGVRGRVVASSLGIAGEWTAQNGQAATKVEKINVKAGDTVDFITDCREHVTSDSFTWQVTLSLKQPDGATAAFRSKEGFHGPLPPQTALAIESIVRAWQLAYLRPPTRDELKSACDFVSQQRTYLRTHPQFTAAGRSPEAQALANLCHALAEFERILVRRLTCSNSLSLCRIARLLSFDGTFYRAIYVVPQIALKATGRASIAPRDFRPPFTFVTTVDAATAGRPTRNI